MCMLMTVYIREQRLAVLVKERRTENRFARHSCVCFRDTWYRCLPNFFKATISSAVESPGLVEYIHSDTIKPSSAHPCT